MKFKIFIRCGKAAALSGRRERPQVKRKNADRSSCENSRMTCQKNLTCGSLAEHEEYL